jgi:hypothetical protein
MGLVRLGDGCDMARLLLIMDKGKLGLEYGLGKVRCWV